LLDFFQKIIVGAGSLRPETEKMLDQWTGGPCAQKQRRCLINGRVVLAPRNGEDI